VHVNYRELPGGELVEAGLQDLSRGVESPEALLVASFAPRLRRLGIPVPDSGIPDPEHRLYAALAQLRPNSAHRRYNALIRRAVAFARALAVTTHA
jgi:hypothetical protein